MPSREDKAQEQVLLSAQSAILFLGSLVFLFFLSFFPSWFLLCKEPLHMVTRMELLRREPLRRETLHKELFHRELLHRGEVHRTQLAFRAQPTYPSPRT